MSEFPALETVNRNKRKLTNNDATFLGAADMLNSPDFADDWKSFFRMHTSMDFLAQALALIGKPAAAIHPSIASLVTSVRQFPQQIGMLR